jgi:hypothetical protein
MSGPHPVSIGKVGCACIVEEECPEDRRMITMDDVLDMTDLTHDEIAAIAEHEDLPDLNAAALAEYLSHAQKGFQAIQQMICEDIRAALHRDDVDHARTLYAVLHHFIAEHPDAARGARDG